MTEQTLRPPGLVLFHDLLFCWVEFDPRQGLVGEEVATGDKVLLRTYTSHQLKGDAQGWREYGRFERLVQRPMGTGGLVGQKWRGTSPGREPCG